MLWVVYQSEFAQLSAAASIWHTNKLGCMDPPFAVALMLQHNTINYGRETMLYLAQWLVADGWWKLITIRTTRSTSVCSTKTHI